MVHAEWLAFGGGVRGQLSSRGGGRRDTGTAPQFNPARQRQQFNSTNFLRFISVVLAIAFPIEFDHSFHKDVLQSGYPTAFDEFPIQVA